MRTQYRQSDKLENSHFVTVTWIFANLTLRFTYIEYVWIVGFERSKMVNDIEYIECHFGDILLTKYIRWLANFISIIHFSWILDTIPYQIFVPMENLYDKKNLFGFIEQHDTTLTAKVLQWHNEFVRSGERQ